MPTSARRRALGTALQMIGALISTIGIANATTGNAHVMAIVIGVLIEVLIVVAFFDERRRQARRDRENAATGAESAPFRGSGTRP